MLNRSRSGSTYTVGKDDIREDQPRQFFAMLSIACRATVTLFIISSMRHICLFLKGCIM